MRGWEPGSLPPAKPMDRAPRDRQRIPLPVATAVVFFRVTGTQVEGRRDLETMKRLNAVARALANLAPIYAGEAWHSAKELSPFDLLGGEFDRGAQVFRTRDGREFDALVIERRDMLAAISILRGAGIWFR